MAYPSFLQANSHIAEWYEDSLRRDLLVYFSSAGAEAPQGRSKLAKYGGNQLFIRDTARNWYNLPIGTFSTGADDLCEKLRGLVEAYGRQNVTMAGSSMGGYAALLFGLKLRVGRIVAVAPQTVLRPDIPNSPRVEVKYRDLLPLFEGGAKNTKVDIWYGTDSALDLFNCLRLPATSSIRHFPVPGGMHNVLATIKRHGKLDAFFEYIVHGGIPPVATRLLKEKDIPSVHDAAKLYYFDRNPQAVIEVSRDFSQARKYSAISYIIGKSYFDVGDLDSAEKWLEQAVLLSIYNYEACYLRGLCSEKNNDFEQAADYYKFGLEYFPSPNAARIARLGNAEFRSGRIDEAINSHTLALEINPKLTRSHFQLGVIYMREGNWDLARFHLRQHLQLVPDFSKTKEYLAFVESHLAR